MTGPLAGVRVVEIASIGPGPFCAMVLSDLGADVTRVERTTAVAPGSDPPPDPLQRGRSASIGIDLKTPAGAAIALDLVADADVLVEGFRPGVMERLGLGPDECHARNPRLVYGRVTGWGQDGPLADRAGHDIDYLAVAGMLHPIGSGDLPPPPPLNLVADFGGGGLLLAFGITAALVERERSGQGQVIDAAMAEGSSLLGAIIHGLRAMGMWTDERDSNLLDGGAPFYRAYRTADGRHVAVGAIEPQFYAELLDRLGLADAGLPAQYDRSGWPAIHDRLSTVFASRTRDEWVGVFDGSDACVVPVNDPGEATRDPHLVARGAFVEVSGLLQPAPAPRFSRSSAGMPVAARPPGADTDAVLRSLGFDSDRIAALRAAGTVA